MTKQQLRVGWMLIVLGDIFLIAGLLVLLFATVPTLGVAGGPNVPVTPPENPSLLVTLADLVMRFVTVLLQVDWTPQRVGVLLIVVGLVLEGGGVYLLMSATRQR